MPVLKCSRNGLEILNLLAFQSNHLILVFVFHMMLLKSETINYPLIYNVLQFHAMLHLEDVLRYYNLTCLTEAG